MINRDAVRLEGRASKALERGDYGEFIRARFSALGYSEYDYSDSDGGGIAESVIRAVTSLGQAAIYSNNSPSLSVAPQNRPVTSSAGLLPSSKMGFGSLLIVAVLAIAGFFIYKKIK